MFYVYILVSKRDGSLYTGQTNDLKQRFYRHNVGSVKSTRHKTPYILGYFKMFNTRAEAMWREWGLKTKISTAQKKKLITEFDQNLIKLVLED